MEAVFPNWQVSHSHHLASCATTEYPSSGLCPDEVQDSRQFSDEQLTEVYRCIHETLDSGYPITKEREDTLATAAKQIEYSVDDLEERVEQSNQRELEAAQGQTDEPAGADYSHEGYADEVGLDSDAWNAHIAHRARQRSGHMERVADILALTLNDRHDHERRQRTLAAISALRPAD